MNMSRPSKEKKYEIDSSYSEERAIVELSAVFYMEPLNN